MASSSGAGRTGVEPHDVLLRNRNHLEIAFLQPALQGAARCQRRDLHIGDVVLLAQTRQRRLQRFLAIPQLMQLQREVDVAQSRHRQQRRHHHPTRQRSGVQTIELRRTVSSQFFGNAQLCAARPRIDSLLVFARFDGLRRNDDGDRALHSRAAPAIPADPHIPGCDRERNFSRSGLRANEMRSRRCARPVRDDSVITRKPSSSAPSSSFTSIRNAWKTCVAGMATSVAADDFLDRARQRQRLPKRRDLAQLHNGAGNATRRRFFAQIAK